MLQIVYHLTIFPSVVLTSFESRRRANGKAIERLKDMLVMVGYLLITLLVKPNPAAEDRFVSS